MHSYAPSREMQAAGSISHHDTVELLAHLTAGKPSGVTGGAPGCLPLILQLRFTERFRGREVKNGLRTGKTDALPRGFSVPSAANLSPASRSAEEAYPAYRGFDKSDKGT
jgi:hypothetical protein